MRPGFLFGNLRLTASTFQQGQPWSSAVSPPWLRWSLQWQFPWCCLRHSHQNHQFPGDTLCRLSGLPSCPWGGGKTADSFHNPNEANDALEVYYEMQLTEQIAITSILFWLSRPLGQDTINDGSGMNDRGSLSSLGDLAQARFRF
jgi:hypothetical protein